MYTQLFWCSLFVTLPKPNNKGREKRGRFQANTLLRHYYYVLFTYFTLHTRRTKDKFVNIIKSKHGSFNIYRATLVGAAFKLEYIVDLVPSRFNLENANSSYFNLVEFEAVQIVNIL